MTMTNREMIEHLVNAGISDLIDEYVESVSEAVTADESKEGSWSLISALEDAGIALEAALEALETVEEE